MTRKLNDHRASDPVAIKSAHRARVRERLSGLLERRVFELTVEELIDVLDAREDGRATTVDRFVSADDLASLLGVRADTIRKWVTRGFCPHYRFGRQVRFNVEEVRRWCEERAEAAGSWTDKHANRARVIASSGEEA